MTQNVRDIATNNVVRLKKAHPCGGRDWRITRTGADIGIECLNCGRRVFLSRDEFERRCVAVISTGEPEATDDA